MKTLRRSWDKNTLFIVLLFALAYFLNGLYYGFQKAIVLVLICLYFLFKIYKKEGLKLTIDTLFFSFLALFAIVLFQNTFYVEKGMSIYLAFTLIFYLFSYIFISNMEDGHREVAKSLMIVFAVVSILLTALFGSTAFLQNAGYMIAGEFAGAFQYSNSFALFLLIALHFNMTKAEGDYLFLASFKKKNIGVLGYIISGIIVLGVYLTHASIGILLTLIYILYLGLSRIKSKKHRWIILAGLFILFILAAVLSVGNIGWDTLFYSDKFSSFKTRFLYYKDAITMIKAHPFGYGYMGYYFAQHSFQTSYDYSVRYVHNFPLQVLLDLGILGFMVFLVLLLNILKRVEKKDIIIVSLIFIYSLFDFHMQYPIFVLLVFLILQSKFKENVIKVRRFFGIILVCLIVLSAYVFAFDYAFYKEDYKTCRSVYPEHTLANIKDLGSIDMAGLEDMVEKNEYLHLVYKKLSERYFMMGDLEAGLAASQLYQRHNELGDFKESRHIRALLDVYDTGVYDGLAEYICDYEDYVKDLELRKGTDINIRHEFDFEIDEDILRRIREVEDVQR